MHKNSMDILTIVPVNEIKRKGIPFVKDNLKDAVNEDKDFQKMQSFWHYFDKFWMTSENLLILGIFLLIKEIKIHLNALIID